MDAFKTLVFDNLVRLALKKLFAKIPLLGWGPIGFLVSHFVFKLTDLIYMELSDALKLELIFLRNKEAHKEYINANIDLAIIYKEKGADSDEFKKAREQHKNALSKFIKFDAARS